MGMSSSTYIERVQEISYIYILSRLIVPGGEACKMKRSSSMSTMWLTSKCFSDTNAKYCYLSILCLLSGKLPSIRMIILNLPQKYENSIFSQKMMGMRRKGWKWIIKKNDEQLKMWTPRSKSTESIAIILTN